LASESSVPRQNERMSLLVLDPVGAEGWGGVERWLWDLAVGLRERGHRVSIAGRPGSRWLRRAADAGFSLCEVPLRGDFHLDQAYRLSRFMLKEGVEVVATKLHKGIRVSGFAAKFAGHPPVVSFMGLVETRPGLRYRLTYELFLDRVVTLTDRMRDEIVSSGALDPDDVVAVPYGIRVEDFDLPESAGFAVRDELDVPRDAPVVLAIGRLHLQKRFDILFEAFARVRQRVPRARLLLAGNGRLRPELEAHLDRLSLRDSAKIIGFRSDVARMLCACDCMAMSSDFEGLPMVVLEAMASSRPVVATSVGSIDAQVVPGVTGHLVQKGDVAGLADALVRVLSLPDRGRAMGRAARESVAARFPLARCVAETERYLLGIRRGAGKHA
jgi:glycosyltransferase involved in cell wall biosynthesis